MKPKVCRGWSKAMLSPRRRPRVIAQFSDRKCIGSRDAQICGSSRMPRALFPFRRRQARRGQQPFPCAPYATSRRKVRSLKSAPTHLGFLIEVPVCWRLRLDPGLGPLPLHSVEPDPVVSGRLYRADRDVEFLLQRLNSAERRDASSQSVVGRVRPSTGTCGIVTARIDVMAESY